MCVCVCVCIYASWAMMSCLSEPGRRVSNEDGWGRGMWIDRGVGTRDEDCHTTH